MFTNKDVMDLRSKTGAGVLDCKKALIESNGDMGIAFDVLRKRGIAIANKKQTRIASEGIVLTKENNKSCVLLEINCETDFVAKSDKFKCFANEIADFILNNDVNNVDELNIVQKDNLINAIAKIGEKIVIRRFEKYAKDDNAIVGSYIHMYGKIGVMAYAKCKNTEQDHQFLHDILLHITANKPLYLDRKEISVDTLNHEKEIAREQANDTVKNITDSNKKERILNGIIQGKLNKYCEDTCLVDQAFVKDTTKKTKDVINEYNKTYNEFSIVKFIRYEMGEGLEKKNNNFKEEVEAQMKKI